MLSDAYCPSLLAVNQFLIISPSLPGPPECVGVHLLLQAPAAGRVRRQQPGGPDQRGVEHREHRLHHEGAHIPRYDPSHTRRKVLGLISSSTCRLSLVFVFFILCHILFLVFFVCVST